MSWLQEKLRAAEELLQAVDKTAKAVSTTVQQQRSGGLPDGAGGEGGALDRREEAGREG